MSNDDTSRGTGSQPDKQLKALEGFNPLKHNVVGGPVAPRRQPRDNPPFDWAVTQRRLTEHLMSRTQASEHRDALQSGSRGFVIAAAMLVGVTLGDEELAELSSRFARYRDNAQALRNEIGASRAAEWLMLELTREVPAEQPANPAEPPQDLPPAPEVSRAAVIEEIFSEAYADYMNSRGPKSIAYRVAKLLGRDEFGLVNSAHQALLDAPPEYRETLLGQITLVMDFLQGPTPQEPAVEPCEDSDRLDVLAFFADPKKVGTSAYRAAYELLDDVAESARGCEEPFGVDEAIAELGELEDVITSMRARLVAGHVPGEPILRWDFGSSSADDLRRKGWTVAVHNDYHRGGHRKTFWLLVDESGWSIKGEGGCDAAALDQIRWKLTERRSFTVTLPDGEPEVKDGISAFHVAMDTIVEEGGSIAENPRKA